MAVECAGDVLPVRLSQGYGLELVPPPPASNSSHQHTVSAQDKPLPQDAQDQARQQSHAETALSSSHDGAPSAASTMSVKAEVDRQQYGAGHQAGTIPEHIACVLFGSARFALVLLRLLVL